MHRQQPIGNKILYARMKRNERLKHILKLKQMKASFKTTSAADTSINNNNNTSINSYHKPMHQRQRSLQVDRDNKLLLKRMRSISNRNNKFVPTKQSTSKNNLQHEHDERARSHLLHQHRKRILKIKQIESENHRLATRLDTCKSILNVQQQHKEWIDNRKYLENACDYPVNLELFGQRDGSISPRMKSNKSALTNNKAPQRPSTTEPSHRRRNNNSHSNSRTNTRGNIRNRRQQNNGGRAGKNVIDQSRNMNQRRPNTTTTTTTTTKRPISKPGRARTPTTSKSGVNEKFLITSPAIAAVMENNNNQDIQSVAMSSTTPSVTWSSDAVRIGVELFVVHGFSLGSEHGGILYEARSIKTNTVYRLTATKTNINFVWKSLSKNIYSNVENENIDFEKGSIQKNNNSYVIEVLARSCLKLKLIKRRLKLTLQAPSLTKEQKDIQCSAITIQKYSRRYIIKQNIQAEYLAAQIVQTRQRGRIAKKTVQHRRQTVATKHTAAIKLQTKQRSRRDSKKVVQLRAVQKNERNAATCLQARSRGRQSRKGAFENERLFFAHSLILEFTNFTFEC